MDKKVSLQVTGTALTNNAVKVSLVQLQGSPMGLCELQHKLERRTHKWMSNFVPFLTFKL